MCQKKHTQDKQISTPKKLRESALSGLVIMARSLVSTGHSLDFKVKIFGHSLDLKVNTFSKSLKRSLLVKIFLLMLQNLF
jgi:hypothetical protein